MPKTDLQTLLEAGVHFGHQTHRWNPKMKPFIFMKRNGIHIIDLAKTLISLEKARDAITETVRRGESILFVCTKKQGRAIVQEEAIRCEVPEYLLPLVGATCPQPVRAGMVWERTQDVVREVSTRLEEVK